MTSLDTAQAERALKHEWLAARIIVIGGFAIAFIACMWFGVIVPKIIQPRELRAALTTRVQKLLAEEAQICTMALGNAKNFGIVPQYGQLGSAKLALTNVQGRYLCLATTTATKYLLAVDLECRDLRNPRCISLYNVTQANGSVLYQRQR